jgi:hypothetical protein
MSDYLRAIARTDNGLLSYREGVKGRVDELRGVAQRGVPCREERRRAATCSASLGCDPQDASVLCRLLTVFCAQEFLGPGKCSPYLQRCLPDGGTAQGMIISGCWGARSFAKQLRPFWNRMFRYEARA